jgi:PAB1-binding protein PBP1
LRTSKTSVGSNGAGSSFAPEFARPGARYSFISNNTHFLTAKQKHMVSKDAVRNRANSQKHKTLKRIMTKAPTQRTAAEEVELEELMKQSKFFQDKEMKYEDFKDLVMNFEFDSFKAGETVFDINSTGDEFYIVMKGVVRVMVKNPSVRDWGIEYKYYGQLKEWKKKFDIKAKQVEKERMEEYQLDMKQKQEEERYQKSKTKGNSMALVVKNLKSTERELLDVFAENLRQTLVDGTAAKKIAPSQGSFTLHNGNANACTETNFIKHFRKADSLF